MLRSEMTVMEWDTSESKNSGERVEGCEASGEVRVQDCPHSQSQDKEFLCRYSLKTTRFRCIVLQ